MARDKIFVSTDWLASRLGQRKLIIIDGSYYLSTMNRDAAAEYAAARIPGAVHFEIDAIKDKTSTLPHMLPGPGQFAEQVGALGISDKATLVIYDGMGLFSAPRVRWTFKVFGARKVFILDGGFPKWKAEGRPIETTPPKARRARSFHATFDDEAVASMADIKAALVNGDATIVDARPADRFAGKAPEPRPNLPSGHMPGAKNVPFATLLENGRLKEEAAIAAALAAGGVNPDAPLITSCGSGVSAAIISTALEMIGKPAQKLYDGSWAEWASTPGNPIKTD